jgi:small multidrug resistance family-3 protein
VLVTLGLFVATACAEIVGCYLPHLCLRHDRSVWLLVPAGASLAIFAWLLTLHPHAAGRTYAAYGGVYVASAVAWLWLVDGQKPDRWDLVGRHPAAPAARGARPPQRLAPAIV